MFVSIASWGRRMMFENRGLDSLSRQVYGTHANLMAAENNAIVLARKKVGRGYTINRDGVTACGQFEVSMGSLPSRDQRIADLAARIPAVAVGGTMTGRFTATPASPAPDQSNTSTVGRSLSQAERERVAAIPVVVRKRMRNLEL